MNNTENIIIRKYEKEDLPDLIRIWNQVVEDGVAFPQEECLDEVSGAEFFTQQTYTAAAVDKETGYVYFVDFDRTHARSRRCKVVVIGE